jgi:heme oxygenase
MNDLILGAEPRAGARNRAAGLPERLRRETAELHRKVEEMTDLPGSVSTREDYEQLLTRLREFHLAVEGLWDDTRWMTRWAEVGIELASHRRAHLLADDLAGLESRVAPRPAIMPSFGEFGEALGCLYVMEGSSLGGRVLGPAFRAALGDVPTAFFDSEGRSHPSPWRSLTSALRRFESSSGDIDAVLHGAQETFLAFGQHLAPSGLTRTEVR